MTDQQPADESRRDDPSNELRDRCVRRHLATGWWLLLVYLTAGAILEVLHGWKVSEYLDPEYETRRLMWTLAHSHGALLSLVHVAFAATASFLVEWPVGRRGFAGKCLGLASVLIPGGFFLGGLTIHEGDPGLGIVLVPAGALCLFVAVLLTGLSVRLKVSR